MIHFVIKDDDDLNILKLYNYDIVKIYNFNSGLEDNIRTTYIDEENNVINMISENAIFIQTLSYMCKEIFKSSNAIYTFHDITNKICRTIDINGFDSVCLEYD
jgi:hypothetical protein